MEMWIVFSLIALLANTAKVLSVRCFCQSINSRFLVLCARFTASLLLIPLLFTRTGIPQSVTFWVVVMATATLTAVASVLLTEAIKKGNLSLVMPMQATVPVFMIFTLLIFFSRVPAAHSTVLIFLTMLTVGCMLYYSNRVHCTEADKRNIFALFSLVAAVIFGICTVLDRTAIASVADGALAYSACWNLASSAILLAECIRAKVVKVSLRRDNIFPICFYSVLTLAAFYCQQYAVQQSLDIGGAVVNVKTIVMLHLPLVIFAGWLLFEEKYSIYTLISGLAAVVCGILLVKTL